MSYFDLSTDSDDTIVALATGLGNAALAIIRLSGNEAFDIISQFLPVDRNLSFESHRLYYTPLIQDDTVLDEVVLSIFKGPNSFTGEDVVEINCHASEYVVHLLIRHFIRAGARLAKRGEFTLRAYLNQKMDLSQAEAVADLISSKTSSQHDLALKQMRGGYSQRMRELRQELMNFASLLELELDFGEEDVSFADRKELLVRTSRILHELEKLIHSFSQGQVIKNGVPVAIIGRPNAGKSSLLNVLLEDDRAIVSEWEGTTRDTIEESLIIEDLEFRLIDTAGIRDTQDRIERLGVERSLEKIESAALLIYLYDIQTLSESELEYDLQKLISNKNAMLLVVGNKIDLVKPHPTCPKCISSEQWLSVSATSQMHIDKLKNRMVSLFKPHEEAYQHTVSHARHHEALLKAKNALSDVKMGLESEMTSDLIAMNLRYGIHSIGSILGELSNEELLGNIFSNFCIGK